MYYHNAFNFCFDIITLRSFFSKGPLPSAESVCAVCDWSTGEIGPSGPGARASMWLDVS